MIMEKTIFSPDRVVALREINNLTQKKLAKLIKTTNRHISMIEKGKVKPNMATFEKILNAFPSVTAQYFFIKNNHQNDDTFSA